MFKNNPRYYFFIFLIIIFLMYPLAYIGNQIITLAQYKEEISGLESELNDIISVNSDIKNEIDEAKSNEFIEKMAREKLKMVKKDEIVYIMVN
jgi:cell division protein DivIC